ncbi:MAG: hypothetical protein AUK03_07045 [Anaerolineae bacterium CG2_30_64_16]|nr:MAG: hypothetical protein AUK03_07045 [Anaerolineae bacterium CG2_30_64_16]
MIHSTRNLLLILVAAPERAPLRPARQTRGCLNAPADALGESHAPALQDGAQFEVAFEIHETCRVMRET